jgi:hypothetical protein
VEDNASPTEPKPRTREADAREAKNAERKLRAAAEFQPDVENSIVTPSNACPA